MSRIGKKPISVPNGVKAELKGLVLVVTGPKGSVDVLVHPKVTVNISDGQINLDVADKGSKNEKSLWGLTRSLVANAVQGVTSGFEKKLEIVGVAYRASVSGKKISFSLGFSHPIDLEIPQGLNVSLEKNIITVSGIDKQQVGEFAAKVRSLKKPEPYKGKGIKYIDEVIRRKAGKVVKAVGGGK